MDEKLCPNCGSKNTYRSKKFNAWICEDCGRRFSEEELQKAWNEGLLQDKYWNLGFCDVAPYSLAITYQQLFDYVKEGNIGCTLFLIRDVFELLIKTPVVILLDGICSLIEATDNPIAFLDLHPKVKALYTNSMQILTTGKWWECIRISIGLTDDIRKGTLFTDSSDVVYKDTIEYLSKIYKMFWFQIPGERRTDMVSWRNRTVGHSCLASTPEENYTEIRYILTMFKNVTSISMSYYRKVTFADINQNRLRGRNISESIGTEVYIVYEEQDGSKVHKIHNFIAGQSSNLAYYDGYDKGKAYLLNYSNGDRYRDEKLSAFLDNIIPKYGFSSVNDKDVNADNLITSDIRELEDELSGNESIVAIPFLYGWLLESTKRHPKGILLLQAEAGMGKSIFSETLNQISRPDGVIWFSDDIPDWNDFMNNSVIRVWHFNSTYFGRSDIYLNGIKDAMLTISGGYVEKGRLIEGNKIIGELSSVWDGLINCENELMHIHFAEALGKTADVYSENFQKERLILVLDGIDELSDAEEVLECIPNNSELADNTYILMITRTRKELPDTLNISEKFEYENTIASLVFTRDEITIRDGKMLLEKYSENPYYNEAVTKYVENSFAGKSEDVRNSISIRFNKRFSELSAYRKLFQLSEEFEKTDGTELLSIFLDVVKNNAPAFYLNKIEMILNVLVWACAPVTIRELAYLSGEQYVSYRFLGMLYDLRAFVKVIRTDRGNCYTLSHHEWEETVIRRFPHGGIWFRNNCNTMLLDIESRKQWGEMLSTSNQGEHWVMKNILSVYCKHVDELQRNWFEEVLIDEAANLWVEYLQSIKSGSCDLSASDYLRIIHDVAYVIKYYNEDVDIFKNNDGGVHCNVETGAVGPLHTILMDVLSENRILENFGEAENIEQILFEVASIYGNLMNRLYDNAERRRTGLYAIKCFRNCAMLNDNKRQSNKDYSIIRLLESCYQEGRIWQVLGNNSGAMKCFDMVIENICRFGNKNESAVKFIFSKVLIRNGILKVDVSERMKYLTNAENILNGLIDNTPEMNYLFYRTWAFRLIAEIYKDNGDYERALNYWRRSVMDAEIIYNRDKEISHKRDLVRSLKGYSEILILIKRYEEAIEQLQLLLSLDGENSIYLRMLVKAYEETGRYEEKNKIEILLKELEEVEIRYSNAYQEVLEVLKYTESSAVKKIPAYIMDVYKTNANKSHNFKINTSVPFEQQELSEEAKAIFANIYRDYWANDKRKNKIIEHENRDRIEMRVKLLDEIVDRVKEVDSDLSFLEISALEPGVITEVNLILSSIPRGISLQIPVKVLAEVSMNCNSSMVKEFNKSGGNSYYYDTLRILKYLFSEYVSDESIAEVREKVPDDFDLSIIFEDETFED